MISTTAKFGFVKEVQGLIREAINIPAISASCFRKAAAICGANDLHLGTIANPMLLAAGLNEVEISKMIEYIEQPTPEV